MILYDDVTGFKKLELFKSDYQFIVSNIKKNYPKACILCCTLFESNEISRLSEDYGSQVTILGSIYFEDMNHVIKEVSLENGCGIIDLNILKQLEKSNHAPYLTKMGMTEMAKAIIVEMVDNKEELFFDYEKDIWPKYPGWEYIESENNDISKSYTNTLHLIKENSNEETCIEKTIINVGSSKYCDLRIDNVYIPRKIATFSYEKSGWYLTPTTSSNGVWVNDKKLEMWKKYRLKSNDKINFNNVEKMVFDKQIDMNNKGKILNNKYLLLNERRRDSYYIDYLATDEKANKIYTVKVIKKNNKIFGPEPTLIVNSINDMVKVLMKLKHPILPSMIDFFENENEIYIVTDYVEGDDLESIIEKFGPQPEEIVVDWGKQLCSALTYLHSQNPSIIYRDMKPQRIFLTPDGKIKLIDFGIAKKYKSGKKVVVAFGTVGYASPEHYERHTTQRSDIFSLGMTMYRLLTGSDPKVKRVYIPIRKLKSELSIGIEAIIDKCVQPDPNKRYQSCEDLLEDLKNYKQLPRKGFLGKLLTKSKKTK